MKKINHEIVKAALKLKDVFNIRKRHLWVCLMSAKDNIAYTRRR